ncbi:MAG TPA: hypothetical protein VGI22_18720 [Xanthobacteraceae bacterium]
MLAKTPDTDIELMMLATNLIEVDGSGDLPPVEILEPQPEKPERPVKPVRYACREFDAAGNLKSMFLVPARGQRIVAIRVEGPVQSGNQDLSICSGGGSDQGKAAPVA